MCLNAKGLGLGIEFFHQFFSKAFFLDDLHRVPARFDDDIQLPSGNVDFMDDSDAWTMDEKL